MKRDTLNAEIKVRVPEWLKKVLEEESRAEELELSDIVRKALKNHARRRPATEALAA